MKSSLIIFAGVGLTALGGCVLSIDADGYDRDYYTSGSSFGSVYAADVSDNSVSFTVTDNGCTDKSFFDVDVRKEDSDEFEIGLRRERQDHCDAVNPAGTTLTWSYQELGIPYGAEITVLNQVRRR